MNIYNIPPSLVTKAANRAMEAVGIDIPSHVIEGRKLATYNDPQRSWLWEVHMIGLDNWKMWGLGLDSDDLMFRCKTVTIPSQGFETYQSDFYGFKKNFAIKKKISHSITTEIEETEDQTISKMLFKWNQIIINSDIRSDACGHNTVHEDMSDSKDPSYKTDMILKMYSYQGLELQKSIKFYGIWPSNVSEVNLAYSQGDSIRYNVEWSFDNWMLEENALTMNRIKIDKVNNVLNSLWV